MPTTHSGEAYCASLLITSTEPFLTAWAQLCSISPDYAYDKDAPFLIGTQQHRRASSVWALRALSHCQRDDLVQQLRWIDDTISPYVEYVLQFKREHSCTVVLSVWAIIEADVPGLSIELSGINALSRCLDRLDLRAERMQDYGSSLLPW